VALVLSVISILIMPTLAYLKGRTGREMESRALVADSVETWVCAYLSVALLTAVGLNAAFGWWADPAEALAMLPVILWKGREALEEAREASRRWASFLIHRTAQPVGPDPIPRRGPGRVEGGIAPSESARWVT
jgi:hypothetical protein